jgi:Ser/Thr protein kinase RdoA (MazF antagonist)
LHLARVAPELPVQRVIATLDGRPEITLTLGPAAGEPRLVRLTSWLDGELLGRATTSAGLRREIGATLGRLNIALRGFTHPGARWTHLWDLQNFGALRPLLDQLPESGLLPSVGRALAADGRASDGPAVDGSLELRELAAGGLRAALVDCLDRFDAVVRPALASVATQVIHADFHGENLLADGRRITGILDFGDALAGPVAMDVGQAACYQLGACGPGGDLIAPALDVVAGYHAVDPLSDADLDLAAEFIVARVAARIIVSQSNAARDPANSGYLLRRTPQAVAHLAALRALPPAEIGRRLRAACHLEVVR